MRTLKDIYWSTGSVITGFLFPEQSSCRYTDSGSFRRVLLPIPRERETGQKLRFFLASPCISCYRVRQQGCSSRIFPVHGLISIGRGPEKPFNRAHQHLHVVLKLLKARNGFFGDAHDSGIGAMTSRLTDRDPPKESFHRISFTFIKLEESANMLHAAHLPTCPAK